MTTPPIPPGERLSEAVRWLTMAAQSGKSVHFAPDLACAVLAELRRLAPSDSGGEGLCEGCGGKLAGNCTPEGKHYCGWAATPPTAATPTSDAGEPVYDMPGECPRCERMTFAPHADCAPAATPSAGDAERQIGVVRITEDEIAVDLTDESGLRDGQPVFTRPQGAATVAVDAGMIERAKTGAMRAAHDAGVAMGDKRWESWPTNAMWTAALTAALNPSQAGGGNG